jgi:hypothetical protein
MADVLGGGIGGGSVGFRVEVILDAEPITGRVIDDGGTVRPFQGWMDLVQAIEHLAAPPAGTSGREAAT